MGKEYKWEVKNTSERWIGGGSSLHLCKDSQNEPMYEELWWDYYTGIIMFIIIWAYYEIIITLMFIAFSDY